MPKKKVLSKYDKYIKIGVLILYFAIWGLALNDFITITPGDEMGVSILYLYILLPLVTLVASIFVGREKWNNLKWLLIIFFAVMYAIPPLTWYFGDEPFIKTILSDYGLFLTGAVISAIGMTIGTLLKKVKNKTFNLAVLIGILTVLIVPAGFVATSYVLYNIVEKQTDVEIRDEGIDKVVPDQDVEE